VRRESARVLLVDGRDRVLLFRSVRHPGQPELFEETGSADIGWIADEFHDTFFFHRVHHHHVDTRGFEQLEASTFTGYRWWPVSALAQATETIVPDGLAALLSDLLAGNAPDKPVHLPWLYTTGS
jgi:hypothetical protein